MYIHVYMHMSTCTSIYIYVYMYIYIYICTHEYIVSKGHRSITAFVADDSKFTACSTPTNTNSLISAWCVKLKTHHSKNKESPRHIALLSARTYIICGRKMKKKVEKKDNGKEEAQNDKEEDCKGRTHKKTPKKSERERG